MSDEKQFTIFVAEDDEWYNKLLVYNLSLNPDYVVKSYTTAGDLIKNLHLNPDVITLDYRLPDMLGDEALGKIKEYNQDVEVVIISEQENIETAVDLLKLGAYDYLVKSKDIRDRLLNTINNIRKNRGLQQRISKLENEVQKKYDFQSSIIGNSAGMQKITNLMSKALETNITVTITGETGTGKEVVAKAIHYNSLRKNKPFVAVNMGAIPDGLIESELFGYEKGAFTNAHARRIGKFEEANGGTLFLDEIGDMDLSMQVKLLRALQEREITRIGGNNTVKIDCRIIVATHRNLQEEVKRGKFREDLFYRLFGLPIELPPLRERDKDALILAKYFVDQFCKENNISPKTISPDAQKRLLSYPFPGNVRELKSVMDLAVVMSNASEISSDDIILSTFDALPEIISEDMSMREYELRILHTYLKRYDNDIKKVADKLAIGQSTIYRMLKEK
ncbi:MAG: sigma-54-dependent transcriptional regulator [Bacteroidia bacterium]